MYPILWSIGKINIYTHGLLIAIGVICGGFLLHFLIRRKNLPSNFILDLCLFSVLGGLIGARLLYFFLYLSQYSHWWEVFYIWQGGLVSYGGLIGGYLVAAIFLKFKKQSFWQWFDLGIAPFFLGWAIGRIGCFLTGDIIGKASTSHLAIYGQWPVALLESGLSVIIAGIGLILILQKKLSLRQGLIFSLCLGFYGVGRLLIDFLRIGGNQTGDILAILLAIILILVLNKSKERSQDGF